MKKEQEQQIVDYYSTTDKYIRSKLHSNAHQSVFTKENDKYQWLILEQKSQSEVEVRQTDRHGTITARDNYELTRNMPKCVSVERLCEGANFQIPFNADEINLIYQFGEQTKAETCANLSAILPQIKDSNTKQIVSTTLNKLNSLSKISCKELTDTTKRQKIVERDNSIRARLAKAKEQSKQPTVAEGKKHRTHSKGKGDMEL
ncbi:MAG: transposon-transfer assisting family protein [Lachnospiraceae bacterium]|nr:transposon-transfer assisting family protein [Lachnospiraceae bacterium]